MLFSEVEKLSIIKDGKKYSPLVWGERKINEEGKEYGDYTIVKTAEEVYQDTFELAKQNKINELSQKCNETIINGFYSDADGIKKLYDFELENQVNLSTKAYQLQISQLAGQPIATVSYYAKGETCHDYTSEQFLKLALDGETWKTTNIVKYKDVLKPKVEACTTVEEVNAISWESDVNATQTTV